MEILRRFDDEVYTFRLTDRELREASIEHNAKWDAANIMDRLDALAFDGDGFAIEVVRVLRNNPLLLQCVAKEYRACIEDRLTGEEEDEIIRQAYVNTLESIPEQST